jgi:hypothetical protein
MQVHDNDATHPTTECPLSSEPLTTPKADYGEIIDRISVPDSPVGIDAQYTHAIIIRYLQRISERLDRIEAELEKRPKP